MSKNKTESVDKPVVEKTLADRMWDEIKDKKIEMFALPNQLVSKYCRPIPIDPNKLYLVSTVSSVLPSLEVAIAPKYVAERVDKYIVITPANNLIR